MNTLSARREPDHGFRARFTTAEFLRMGEFGAFDDMRVELIDGELERLNPPMGSHSKRQTTIMLKLGAVVGDGKLRVELGVRLSDDTAVACDCAILNASFDEHRLAHPSELVLAVEIAETTRSRDVGFKRVLYATAGIPHYWVVDGDRAVVHIYGEPSEGDYSRVSTVGFGEPLDVPGTDATIVID